jgi:DNA-binding GntR family transcriptional regulator
MRPPVNRSTTRTAESGTTSADAAWSRVAESVKRHLQRNKRGSTTDAVTDALREAILDGVIPSSTWLREDHLAQALAVSRTPIRESIRRLADEHLVSRTANRGSMVQPMTIDDVSALYLIREALEGLAVFTVTSRPPIGMLDQLTEVHEAHKAAVARGDTADGNRMSLEFHRVIRHASANPYLVRFLDQVENMIRRSGVSTYADPDRAVKNFEEHQTIIDAISSGDADAAQDAVAEHMQHAREARVNAMMVPNVGPRRRRIPAN